MSEKRIPTSWTEHPCAMSTMVNLIQPFSGISQVFLTEVISEKSTSNARCSINTTSAGRMSFWTNGDVLDSDTNMQIFTQSILGGYSGLNNKKNRSLQHPKFRGLVAKDIVDMVYVSPIEGSEYYNYQPYNNLMVTISFESCTWASGTLEVVPGTYNPNWIEFRYPKVTAQRINVPSLWFQFTAPPYANLPAQAGFFVTAPTNYLEYIIYQVPHSALFDNYNDVNPFFAPYFGMVNDTAFSPDIGAAEILFDNAQIQGYYNWSGVYLYQVSLICYINKKTWITMPDPSGNFREVTYVNAPSERLFKDFDFNGMVERLNPLDL